MNTQPTPSETDAARQLREVAAFIETYRVDLGMSNASLLRQYPELGTDKTYGKIIKGDLTELKIEDRWLPAYLHVWDQIQSDDAEDDSELITDMAGPVELCRAYLETRNEKGNARFILILGDTGIGKSSSIRSLKAKPYGGLVIDVEAVELWKNKNGRGTAVPLLRVIGKRLGLRDLPSARDALLDVLVKELQGKRRCLAVEEAHHLCPEGVNALKTLINLTPSIIIATAMPVLWDKLSGSRSGWAECKQLTGNRLAERVYLRLQIHDITKLLSSRLPEVDSDLIGKAADRLLIEAPHYGNFAFIKAVVKRFKREVRSGQDTSLETFANAIAAEKKRR